MVSFLYRYREPLLVGVLLVAPLLAYLAWGRKGREPNIIDRTVLAVSAPLQSALTWVATGIHNTGSGYFALRGAHLEAAECRVQLAEARAELNALKEQEIENLRLRQALSYSESTADGEVLARLIGVNPSPQFQSVRVDRGADDGIHLGMPVVAPVRSSAGVPQGAVVGQVIRVVGSSADVMLLTDPASRIGVMVQRTRSRGTVVGSGDGRRMALENIRREDELTDGDVVVTAGTDGVFPRGLVVGVVRNAKAAGVGMFRSAQLEPTIDTHTLEEVFLIPGSPLSLSTSPAPAGLKR